VGEQIVIPIDNTSAGFRAALACAWLRMRRWIARRRRRESLADLSDWILRDIGLIRERDIYVGRDMNPREEARQFWLR
jgi:uncharacterized protein YjiS (DUF1127 family)